MGGKRIFLYLCMFIAASVQAHPFYVSILEMHFNPKTEVMECAIKLFTDDLEHAIGEHSGEKIYNLGSNHEPNNADVRVWRYVEDKLALSGHTLNFVGREGDVDAQWIYFEAYLPDVQELELQWETLIHALPSQKNILQLHFDGKQRTFIFDRRNTRQSIPLHS